jgi:thiamine biosynthesis lipoprotein
VGAVTVADRSEVRFAAMGSDVHVVVVGGSANDCARAHERIDELEACWSRFRPDSQLSRLNRSAGHPVRASASLLHAVNAAVEGWRSTGGRFDPTVLPALVAAGYDRDFARVRHAPAPADPAAPAAGPAPGCAGIRIDPIVGAITLPIGTAIDLGGIGKGLAADLVVADLAAAGVAGACVNVGGDLRVWGRAPTDDGWVVDLEHRPELRFALADGAIATSSSYKRHWVRDGSTVHHLLDPQLGRSARAGLVAVTVIAGTASAAEVLTKAAFVAGEEDAAAIIGEAGATGVLVTDADDLILLPGVAEFLR